MGDLALGIDCSSTASKVVAWDRNGLAGVGDMFVTSTDGRNIRVGRLLGGGLLFSDARARMGDITLEGTAAIQVIGGALPKLTDRGVIGPDDFPLLRQLHVSTWARTSACGC
jgi:glycerol-3-phosphate dehydrogenase